MLNCLLTLLIYKTNIVHPERVAYSANVCSAVARRELQHDVCRRSVGWCPSGFLHEHALSLGVAGVVVRA